MEERTDEERKKYISSSIGKKIFNIRKEKKISREKLAEKSNLSTTYIFGIENGQSMPSCLSLIDICNALEIHPSILLDEFILITNKNKYNMLNFEKLTTKEKKAVENLIEFLSKNKADFF